MKKSIVFMFSGQGSHYFQMGSELYQSRPRFKYWMDYLDQIVQEKCNRSVINYMYQPTHRMGQPFQSVGYTHPAIFMVGFSLAQLLMEEEGIEPDYSIGTSLGEFISLALAGSLEVEEALNLVLDQATIIEETCADGGMLAIIGPHELYHKQPLLHENSELAAVNFDSHFVIAGRREPLQRIETYIKGLKEYSSLMLDVQYGFHSAEIEPAASAYIQRLDRVNYKHPKLPIFSCLTGERLPAIPKEYLWDVVREAMQFRKAIQRIEEETGSSANYIDVGPAGTLANFVKHSIGKGSSSQCFAMLSPFDQKLKGLENMKKHVTKSK